MRVTEKTTHDPSITCKPLLKHLIAAIEVIFGYSYKGDI